MKSSRQIVLELLTKMAVNGAYSNIVLDNTFTNERLSAREKSFATMLFYGVIERKMMLDYIIRLYSSMEFDKIDTAVVQLLRMGLYQLMYMDSVPENAAVNETVQLAPHSAKGFVNGILRSFIRDGLTVNYKDLEGIPKQSIQYSCPKWLIKKWTAQYGEEETVKILEASFGRPPLYAKVNTIKTSADNLIEILAKEKIKAVRNPLLEDCIEIGRIHGVESTNSYRKGLFHIQDISSQLCCKIARPVFNETVIDICAAPGGKTFSMAEAMANRGKIYSFDLYNGKVSMINESAKRLGLDIVKASVNDAMIYNPSIPHADKVLCDVVCSGLGVIRRKPEIKYKQMKNLEELPKIQRQILDVSSRYVKVGGTLIYSTCTLNDDENDKVVDDFLEQHTEFAPVVVPISVQGVENCYKRTFFPQTTGGDGFFAATLRRVR